MKINTDWHIHTHNSCDEACMLIPTLLKRAKEEGIERFGITDHLHSVKELPDIESSRREYLRYRVPGFHFGVEVSVMLKEELKLIADGQDVPEDIKLTCGEDAELAIALNKEDIERLGIEYVIGGTHWPIGVKFERNALIRNYHRQNMFLATHKLIDIVAHPWWFHSGYWENNNIERYQPWFDDFGAIPRSMHDEFASAIIENGKLVEINLSAMLLHPRYPEKFKEQYLEYLKYLKDKGVKFTIGSDCHNANYDVDFKTSAQMLTKVGIDENDLWYGPAEEK